MKIHIVKNIDLDKQIIKDFDIDKESKFLKKIGNNIHFERTWFYNIYVCLFSDIPSLLLRFM